MCTCSQNTNNNSNCNPTPCGCKTTLLTDCVINNLPSFCTIGNFQGRTLTEVLDALDAYICELSSDLLTGIIFRNVGEQAEVYKGTSNVDGVEEFRTIASTDSVDVNQGENTIEPTINEAWLTDFITVVITTTDLTSDLLVSIGDEGIDVYKGFNTSTNKHEIRKIKSDSFEVIEDGDSIRINEVSIDDNQTFYVNNNYNGTVENGSLSKPYKTIDNALNAVIGTGTIETPEFSGARIIVLPSATIYGTNTNLFIRFLTFQVDEGARVLFGDTTSYMVDTRDLLNHPDFVNTEGYSMSIICNGLIESTGGLIYGKGNGNTSGNGVNVSLYGQGRMGQIYDVTNTINIPETVGGSDFISFAGSALSFYDGDPNTLPAIVCDGDNGTTTNVAVLEDGLTIIGSTQTVIQIKNKGYFYSLLSELSLTLLQPIVHYGTTSGTSGNPTVITPNEDFNLVRIESDGTFNCKTLNFEFQRAANDTYIYYNELIKIETTASQFALFQLTGGRIVSQNEFNNILNIYGTANANITITDTEMRFGGNTNAFTDRYIVNSEDGGSLTSITFNRNITDRITDPQIDLTRGNIFSPVNTINNNQVVSYRVYPTRVAASSAGLLSGTAFVNTNNNDANSATHFLDVVI